MSDDRIDDVEERLFVLRDKAAREGFSVPPDVLDYIAEKFAFPQTLKGALINVQAYASRRDIPVDMDVARLVLDGIRPAAAQGGRPAEEPRAQEMWLPAEEEPVGTAPGEPLSLEDALSDLLGPPLPSQGPAADAEPTALGPAYVEESLFVSEAPPVPEVMHAEEALFGPHAAVAPAVQSALFEPAVVWFAPVRTAKKDSLVTRIGRLLERAGLRSAIGEGDFVAIKLHFGEEGNTGFVHPVYLREVVRLVGEAGGKPFLTDSNTLYRGKRANAVDHIACAIHNGFSFATVGAPVIIADGIDGREAVDVPIPGFGHFDSVRIGSAVAHADAMVVVTHVKGHEATGMGGALKNVGMGLGCRSAKQRMHSDLKPSVGAEKCTACGRCVRWCPVDAIVIGPDRVAVIDDELCYGCGECVAACSFGAIAIQWKTESAAIQEKIVEHAAGALAGKQGKVIYLSFVVDVSPDCDCWHFSDASVVSDIGVLAATDIVAIDQAALDLVTRAPGLAGSRGEGLAEGDEKFERITGVDPTLGLAYAERHGLGTRAYTLRTLD